jgi:hypothetical protein
LRRRLVQAFGEVLAQGGDGFGGAGGVGHVVAFQGGLIKTREPPIY